MKKLIAWGIFSLAVVVGVLAWAIWSSSKTAAKSVDQNVGNLNTLAGQISHALSSLGVQK